MISNLLAVHVKLVNLNERKNMVRKHRRNMYISTWNLLLNKGLWRRFKRDIQQWILQKRTNYLANADKITNL